MLTEDLATIYASCPLALAAVYDAAGVNSSLNVFFDEPYLAEVDIGGTNPTARPLASSIPASGWKDKTI